MLTRKGSVVFVSGVAETFPAEGEQNADDREVGDETGSAVAEERNHDAGERDQTEHTTRNQYDLQSEGQGESEREEEVVIGACTERDANAKPNQGGIECKHCEYAQESPFLAKRSQDEIGMSRGHPLRIAQSEAGAEGPAGGERPKRMRHLFAAANRVVPR